MTDIEEDLEICLDEALAEVGLRTRSIKVYDKGVRIWCDYLEDDEDEDEGEDEGEDEDISD